VVGCGTRGKDRLGDFREGIASDEEEDVKQPLIVSYGGGVNSAAMLVGMHERGIRPDLILFADTGGERPETYEYVKGMNAWLDEKQFPGIVTVSVADNAKAVAKTLEEQCLRLQYLPSIAYGYKACSQRWKGDPIEKYINNWSDAAIAWGNGTSVIRAIGYDAGEPNRGKSNGDIRHTWWFPLREWGWSRRECVEAIKRAGLDVPSKSACFFCPSSKKYEILGLKREHPELFERAIAIERNAAKTSTSVKGLGRNWSWESLAKADDAQFKLFEERIETPCGCYDGDEEEQPVIRSAL